MHVRRLEILEGLPDEVFDMMLICGYANAVRKHEPSAELKNYSSDGTGSWQVFKDGGKLSGPQDTVLLAWKEAFDRLNS